MASLSPSTYAFKAGLHVPPALQARHAPAAAFVRVRGKGRRMVACVAAFGDARPAIDEYPEGSLSDLRAYLESHITTSGQMSPTARLWDVMSRPVQVATPGQRLAEVDAFFATQYSGLPVVDDDEGKCVGVVSKKDKTKASNGMESTVGEVMSSPAITVTPDKTVLEAATLMLKHKVHRIPIVNEQNHVIGIITRTDVFQAFEANKA